MRVEYTSGARKELKSLDKAVAVRIIKKIAVYTADADPRKHAKPLAGSLAGLYRFWIGDYRVIFSVAEDGTVSVLTVLTIAHRKDIYRKK